LRVEPVLLGVLLGAGMRLAPELVALLGSGMTKEPKVLGALLSPRALGGPMMKETALLGALLAPRTRWASAVLGARMMKDPDGLGAVLLGARREGTLGGGDMAVPFCSDAVRFCVPC